MKRKAEIRSLAVAVAASCAGCTALPADYAATLSQQDPKYLSPECQQIRVAAANYQEKKIDWAPGLMFGPYGLGIMAAGKEHQQKQRILLAREVHLRCSSLPLPASLQIVPSTTQNSPS